MSMLKIAVFAPMPSVVRTAIAVNTGCCGANESRSGCLP
jgi:hypothetical protein